MKSTTKTLLQKGGAVFLLPEEVGSSVRWHLTVTQHTTKEGKRHRPDLDMEVSLTDCSRAIHWSGYGDGTDMEIKLDRAITELSAARAALRRARQRIAITPHDQEDDED